MNRTKKLMMSSVLALLMVALMSSVALAHYCTNPNKEDGAGSIGTYNVVTETFEPNKKLNATYSNGGFITITDGYTFSYDIYLHQTLPEGALAAGPGGDDQCDGKGVDNFLACLGIYP